MDLFVKGCDLVDEIKNMTGLTGMLRAFAQLIKECENRESMAFIGMPFTCTPLVDFFVYVARDLVNRKYYFPEPELKKGYELFLGDDRIESRPSGPIKADIVVVMGGIAMPDKWDIEEARSAVQRLSHGKSKVLGVCFMDIFNKAGWMDSMPFDYVENCYISTDAYELK